ncbi:MAG: tetratricopeptide repeat protein, partial [Thermoplasmata archaeon]
EAAVCFDRILETNDEDVNVWTKMAQALMSAGDPSEAVESLRSAVNNGVQNWEIWLALGRALRCAGKPADSLSAFDKAYSIEDETDILVEKSKALFELKKYRQVVKTIENVPGADKKALLMKADSLRELGSFKEAIKTYKDVVSEGSPQDLGWYGMSLTYSLMKKPRDALRCIDMALAINENCAEYWYEKGILLSGSRSKKKALEYLEVAVEIDPDFSEARKERDRIAERWDGK